MEAHLNHLNQPVGEAVPDWPPPTAPAHVPMPGSYCTLEPLSAENHAADLFAANQHDPEGRNWTYLFYGPFATLADYRAWVQSVEASTDPLFFAIVDRASGRAAGIAAYLRINPTGGSIEVGQQGQTALQVLQAGQGLFIPATGPVQEIRNAPGVPGPRPDEVNVPGNLFAESNVPDSAEGLFVFVRDGQIEIASASEVLHLGKGEAGFASFNGETARPTTIPKFLDFDRIPLPDSKNPLLASILGESGIRSGNTCK